MIAVSPQNQAYNQKTKEQKNLTFPLLSDQANQVAATYGLKHGLEADLKEIYQSFNLDLDAHNGDPEPWTLPLPASYVIDTQGVIRYAVVNADYTHRPEIEETIAAVKAL